MNQILYSGKTRKKPIIPIIAICLILIVFIFSLGFGLMNLGSDKILNGVVVANIDVSNMTKEEAIEAINKLYSSSSEKDLILTYGETKLTLSTDDIGFAYTDAAQLIEEAYSYGREGNIFKDNFTVLKSFINTEKRIDTEGKIDIEKLEYAVEDMLSGDNVFSKDDFYEISGDKLIITKGTEGRKIDYDSLAVRVIEALKTREMIIEIPVIVSEPEKIDIDLVYDKVHREPKNATYKEGEKFEIIKEEDGIDFDKDLAKSKYMELKDGETTTIELTIIEPEVKINDLGDVLFKNLIATYKSEYDVSQKDRVTNLQIAANKCNNTILYPGDEFSYNNALGHRTTANGYKVANSFAGGKVVQTVGGGICQVSSTLYNAVLRAGLTITDRTAHGMYVQYVPQSTDATVVDNAIDFKFRNDREYPVKIVTTCENGVVTASIYGIKKPDESTIEIEVKVLETKPYSTQKQYDSTMKKGTTKIIQKPVNGYVSESYKVYYKDGKEISRELISKDTYAPINEIIKVGTKEETPVVEVPDKETPSTTPDKPNSLLPPGWDNPESGY